MSSTYSCIIQPAISHVKQSSRTAPLRLPSLLSQLADAPEGKFPEIDALKSEVEAFAAQFPTIGFDKAEGKYTQAL